MAQGATTGKQNLTQINSNPLASQQAGMMPSVISTTGALNSTQGSGPFFATVAPYGALRVSQEMTTLLYDPFDGSSIDTTNKWNTLTQTSGGTVVISNGVVTLSSSTTVSSVAALVSQSSFVASVPGFCQHSYANKVEAQTANLFVTQGYRFFGVGTAPGTPTPSAPLTDAIGFEIDLNGKMWAVVYAGGVRTAISTGTGDGSLMSTGTNKAPSDGGYHRYIVVMRTDRTYWYIDSLDVPVAVSNFQSPNVQTLPVRLMALSSTSSQTTQVQLITSGLAVADSGRNSEQMSDGTYPWRKAKVNANGDQVVSLSSPLAAAQGIYGLLSIDGNQRVTVEPHALLVDPFDGTLDTTVRWSTTGTAPTTTSGSLTVAPGVTTTASAASAVFSQASFVPSGLNSLVFACVAKFEYPLATNTSRFLGVGVPAGSPTATAPLTDGAGFEVYTDGTLNAVVYVNGTRNVVANLSSKLTDSNNHRFGLVKRTDLIAFYIDSLEVPVALSTVTIPATYFLPNQQILPVRFHQYNASSAPSANSFAVAAFGLHDTGSNANQISDGTYPWRKASVTSGGALVVAEGLGVNTVQGPTALNSVSSVTISTAGGFELGANIVGTQTSGTYTVVFETTIDGTNWFSAYGFSSSQNQMINTLSGTTAVSDITTFAVASATQFRVRCTSVGSGTNVLVTLLLSPHGGLKRIAAYQANAVLPTLIENQPTNAAVDLTGATYITNKPSATVAVAGSGTAGTPGTAVLAVQGVSGGTAQPMAFSDTTGTDTGITTTGGVPAALTNGGGTFAFTITLASGTLTSLVFQLEGSVDGTNYVSTQFHQVLSATSGGNQMGGSLQTFSATTLATPLSFIASASGFQKMRPNFTTLTGTSPNLTVNWLVQQNDLLIRQPVMSAPAFLSLATTSETAIIAAPAAGLSIYVTGVAGTNAGTTSTQATLRSNGAGTTSNQLVFVMAAGGGGFDKDFVQPWKLPAATAFNALLGTANQSYFTVNYYIAP